MRLNTQHKQKLTKTDKAKKASRERKSKGPKLMSKYKSMDPYNTDAITLPITQMTYGIVKHFDLVELITSDGVINIQYNWLQCLLIMIDTVMTNYPNKFMKLFSENEVTNQFFMIDSLYGKYSMDDNYKAYKVFDKNYYLETTLTPDVIFDALVGLIKCLELPLDAIQFHVINKDFRNLNLRFDKVSDEDIVLNISDAYKDIKNGTHIELVNILGEVVNVHRMDVTLLAFCNIIYDKFGIQKLLTLPKYESTGICMVDPENPNPHIMQIRGSMVAVYSDGDTNGIYEFIRDSVKTLKLKDDDIKIKFKKLKPIEKGHK